MLAIEYHVYIWQMLPVKYGCDSKNITGTFAKSKILFTGKLTNGALVTPTPGPEQTVVQTIETPVIWDAIAFILTAL